MKFWQAKDAELIAKIREYHNQYDHALAELLKFSRRQWGSRSRVGISETWGRLNAALCFTNEPDRAIWKPLGEYWQPKANKAALPIAEEFNALCRLLPSKWMVYNALNYCPMSHGFGSFAEYKGGVCILTTGDTWGGNKKVKRVSDVDYEKLLAKSKGD